MKLSSAVVFALSAVTAALPVQAQSRGDGAFLFAYQTRPGMEQLFEDGYRRHLGWHAEHRDSLAWLAWTVVAGPRVGLFVDGTLGIPFAAFDARVDPTGDGADADRNVTPYSEPVYRTVHRLRRDLSSAARLEERRAAPMQQVLWLTLRPGAEDAFERAMRDIRTRGSARDYALYELVTGGVQPAFMLVVQVERWGDLEDGSTDVSRAVLRATGVGVAEAVSEIWRFRPDLTYIPR